MTTFWEALSDISKERWAGTEARKGKKRVIGIYEKFKGKKWEVPTKDKRDVQVEAQYESLEEISHFMEEVPNPTRRE